MSDLLNPGQVFAGRYRIDRFLAKGGFGAVYAAEQIETELLVALKVLWPHVLFSKDAVDKFKLEARVAGRVGSEHIVKVFDAGFDAETEMPFLVMELLKGAHLQHVVETHGVLKPEALVTYFRQMASALDRAHGYVDRDGVRRPIVHRDLKPENLFLSERETGDPIVKILDFGIAKVLSNSTNVSQEVKGTPLYMAFEQASAGKVTPQTDIWALGLIAFYLLTGRCYWKTPNLEEGSLTQLFGEVLSLPIAPASQRARELGCAVVPGPGFDAWLARCLQRDPAARFATAGECAASLASVLLGGAGAAPVEAFGATARAPVAAAVSVLPAASTEQPVPSGVGATTAQPLSLGKTGSPVIPKSSSAPLVIGLSLVAVAAIGSAGAFALRGSSSTPDPAASASAESAVAAAPVAPPPAPSPQPVSAPPLSAAPAPAATPSSSAIPIAPPVAAKPAAAPRVAPRAAEPKAALVATPPAPAPQPPPKKPEVYEDR